MDDDRAARIDRLERIDRLAKAGAVGDPNSPPGVGAMGNTDGPTTAAKEEQPLSSKLQNTLAGYGQGATVGYLPQINGGIQAVGNMVRGEPANYVGERDAEIARLKKASEENPHLFGGAKLIGGIASALMMPGGAGANATRLAKVLSAARGGAAIGALSNPGDKEGVIDPIQADKRVMNAGLGMGVGALTSGAAEGIAEYGPKAFNSLAETQAFKALGPYARSAVNAVTRGAKTPEEQALLEAVPGGGIGNVRSIGRSVLDNNLFGGIIPRGYKAISQAATKAKGAAGEKLEGVLGQLSEAEKRLRERGFSFRDGLEPVEASADGPAGAQALLPPAAPGPTTLIPPRASSRPLLGETPKAMVVSGEKGLVKPVNALETPGEGLQGTARDVGGSTSSPGEGPPKWTVESGLKRQQIADSLRKDLISPHTDVAGVADANAHFEDLISKFENGGDEHIPLMEAELKKRAAGNHTNFDTKPSDMTTPDRFHNALSNKLKTGVEDYADVLDKEVNGPSASTFIGAKNEYGNLSAAEAISQKRFGHELAKHFIAPAIGGSTGAAVGATQGHDMMDRLKNAIIGGGAGAIGGLAMRQGRMYSPQIIAKVADSLAKNASKATNLNPWMAPALATQGDE